MARIITSDDDVPRGWVRIADLTDNATDAKILSDAHNSGDLDAVKLIRTTSEIRTGPVWVDPTAAGGILSRCQAKRHGTAKPITLPQAIPAAAVAGDDTIRLLERIAVALEAMATRP